MMETTKNSVLKIEKNKIIAKGDKKSRSYINTVEEGRMNYNFCCSQEKKTSLYLLNLKDVACLLRTAA